jgi:hypothetical protein
MIGGGAVAVTAVSVDPRPFQGFVRVRSPMQPLIEDIEAVRRYLNIETWLVPGVSGGQRLAAP